MLAVKASSLSPGLSCQLELRGATHSPPSSFSFPTWFVSQPWPAYIWAGRTPRTSGTRAKATPPDSTDRSPSKNTAPSRSTCPAFSVVAPSSTRHLSKHSTLDLRSGSALASRLLDNAKRKPSVLVGVFTGRNVAATLVIARDRLVPLLLAACGLRCPQAACLNIHALRLPGGGDRGHAPRLFCAECFDTVRRDLCTGRPQWSRYSVLTENLRYK